MSDSSPHSLLAGTGAVLAAAATGVAMLVLAAPEFRTHALVGLALFVGVLIAGFHGVFVAGPLYVFAKPRWPLRWWSAALGGYVSGIIPFTIFWLFHTAQALASGYSFEIMAWLEVVVWLGGSGAVGGLVFRAIYGRDPRLIAEQSA